MSSFEILSKIDCSEQIEQKNGLSYLSWAWAWGIVKKHFPSAQYKIYENKDDLNYHTDGKTAWVKTGVIIEDIEHIEYLPVMDFRNKSIVIDAVTSFDVNKAIQRSLTKAIARHGLGLYIYAGEDLPEIDKPEKSKKVDDIIDLINQCKDEDCLKKIFTEGYKSVIKFNDENLTQKLIEAKDAKKIELNEVQK